MKRALVSLSVFACLCFLLGGCSEQKAEKDYKRILDAELAGGEPKTLIPQYQALIDQYPDAASATRARERLIALKTRVENDAKAAQLKAEQEEKERKLKAEQEEKERLQKQKERETLEAEVKRQAKLLGEEMLNAVKKAALRIHNNTEITEITPYGETKGSEDWENKVWVANQTYTVRLRGTALLDTSTYSEIIECRGEVRLNEVTKQFERSTNAKPVGKK